MTKSNIAAVLTTFRPDDAVLGVVNALHSQVTSILIVDDGSGEQANSVLARAQELGARVIRLTENSGIAVALNTGIQAALHTGADMVVTFDQDSTPAPGFIDALTDAHARAVAVGRRPGPVVPEYFADVRQVHRVLSDGTLIARHAIQSGMLLSHDLLECIGLMREDLFIDLVDTEFEMRCSAAGRPTVAAPGLQMGHSLGRRYRRMLWGRPFHAPGIPPLVTLSTPFRYYYRVRNRIVVNGEYWRSHFGWIMRDSSLEVLHYANALMIARPRRRLWSLYASAISDARQGRMGKMPESLQSASMGISWAAPLED